MNMKKLSEIIKPFVPAEETCKGVSDYFKNGNDPKGPYFPLMQFFKGNSDKASESDKAYKKWLEELVNNGREKESVVLKALKEYYKEKDQLRSFVFLMNEEKLEYNQKWHFFIGYWGYREFVTKYPDNNSESLTPLKNGDEANDINPFRYCEEGKIWYSYWKK